VGKKLYQEDVLAKYARIEPRRDVESSKTRCTPLMEAISVLVVERAKSLFFPWITYITMVRSIARRSLEEEVES
jgi:hypothetical protein